MTRHCLYNKNTIIDLFFTSYTLVNSSTFILSPLKDTEGAESTALFTENPELSNLLSLKPGVGQKTALDDSPAARNFTLLMSIFPVQATSFFPNPL